MVQSSECQDAVDEIRFRNNYTSTTSSQQVQTTNNNVTDGDDKKKKSQKILPEKVFVARESLLTSMFQVQEFRGLYNIFLVIFFNLFVYAVLSDLSRYGTISLGWSNIINVFGKPWLTLAIIAGLHFHSVDAYLVFNIWRRYRLSFPFVDKFLTLYLIFKTVIHLYIPIYIHQQYSLPVACGAAVVVEQVRLLMKMYAYHRVNIARVLNGTFASSFAQYVYFLYAPTLIYQDTYPRTKSIRWDFVFRNLIELLGCISLYNLIHYLCGWVLLQRFGLDPITPSKLVDALFFQMIPGGVGWLLGFFILLHTSQNISAEILRFGDRQFYKDWWNSETFGEFYRNWNLPVHGFLYTYIYKEVVELGYRSKLIPALSVFFVSAVVHEYILAYALGFFFPVLFVFFGGFGAALSFCGRPKAGGNQFIWWSLITGKGLLLFFYALEHFARVNNCPPAQLSPFWDFVTPRSLSCLSNTLTYS